MKVLIISSLLLLLSLSICARGQQLNRVTLYSGVGYRDTSRSAFNFETGERGHLRNANGVPLAYDISYGQVVVGPNRDLFQVFDARSMIADLGKKAWDQFKETPPVPTSKRAGPPRPLDPPQVLISRGYEINSPYQQFIKVNAEHMYLMRPRKGNKVIYVMFRVESLKSGDHCELTWKRVPPPRVDNEE